ncbi:hypothetical protein BO83DRAFT_379319 [Aspergillus eucalypticola CBS 122712]|uniref:Uncharacterized protein n=1 Tax=Aspergillus eucalypticola (strain CBS 122712 / IBT 29274) TaxID=1448314 RepID=A0A317VFA4_ASPEC|nr:uncharacterized protein BO83DRAFT_379319 [Aspergillus eucalypticola CBS 122712]PWY70560.1 hypothetical protein BO83DRAFT_379319 [Aspergillus eucalypticola CBS 122712]
MAGKGRTIFLLRQPACPITYLGSGLPPPKPMAPLSSRPHQFVWLSGGSTYDRDGCC